MEDWGELALMYLEDVDPRAVWGIDLDNVIDTFRAGGFTRVEAGAVARWLFACLPPQSSDGARRFWLSAADDDDTDMSMSEAGEEPAPTVH